MRKYFIAPIIMCLLVTGVLLASDDNRFHAIRPITTGTASMFAQFGNADGWEDGVLGAGSMLMSDAIDLVDYRVNGNFSLQLITTGNGDITVEMLQSNNNVYYYLPDGYGPIATSIGAGSQIYEVDVAPTRYIKLKVTETGGSNTVTFNDVMIGIH